MNQNNQSTSLDGKTRKYLIEELKMPLWLIHSSIETLKKHDDLYQEFGNWLDYRLFPEKSIEVNGQTIKTLLELQPKLSVFSAYLFLAGLRDEPDLYNKYLAEGIPVL
ncbi:MAG: hypothetical protein Q4A79_01765 [Candidatus Saccharibacteria bacterium]|nr:hypothetical protein [Candidatus Saccharibacteria bacterium]